MMLSLLLSSFAFGGLIAPSSLETSEWYTRVTQDLQRAEYRFRAVQGDAWTASNPAHAFDCRVSPRGLEVTSVGAPWSLRMATSRFGRIDDAFELAGASAAIEGERAELDHGWLVEWFVNGARGVEHGYTIARPPGGAGHVWIGIDVAGELDLRIDAGARSGVFVDALGAVCLRYSQLVVFDANGCKLDARLAPGGPGGIGGFGIAIDDAGARYPLTVDPLLSGPAWTADGDLASANFGSSVAPAGDVNGDGFSDVIVGAVLYGNGEGGEGRAFVFHGSAGGLSTTPSWTYESNQALARLGESVGAAGDVNGDGFSDVIVGAPRFSNGEPEEGRAFVFLGSAAGLSATPAWTAESNQANASYGQAVSTAGDVNGDGYSDVIVGARLYDNGQSAEGRAYVYLGSGAGLSTSAAWTTESDQLDAEYGHRVGTAGDVNGDGYDDAIVGAYSYTNGQLNEGRAYVYHGSSTGLSTSAAWTAEGDSVNVFFGYAIGTAGDVNGDGYADVIVGAFDFDNGEANEGRAYAYLGSSSGLSTSASWTTEGNLVNLAYATSVATAGDINGDGYSDVIVGAPGFDGDLTDEGRAYVYLGSSSGLSVNVAWTSEGNQVNAEYGDSLALAGDVNGDGYSDVIVGAYRFGTNDEGRAFVYTGSAAGPAILTAWSTASAQASAGYGYSVACAGDVNADGYTDAIVGAYDFDGGQTDEGRALVYLGSSTGLATSAAWTAESNQAEANFGWSVACAGDVNGDGYDDVIVGALAYDDGQSDEGRAYVYLGSSTGLATSAAWTAASDQALANYGWCVASAGDVDGDGYGDVLVAAYKYDDAEADEGRAFLYLGSSTGLATSAAWTAGSGQQEGWYGFALASAGDVNGDGYSDVIVGSQGFDNGQANEGRAFVYLGSASGLSTSAVWTAEGEQDGAQLGYSVASAGDVNGDAFSDVIVGAAAYDNGQLDEGRVLVFHGSPAGPSASPAATFEANQAVAGFGVSVASAGDVNSDGYGDVIVGSPYYDSGETNEGRAFLYLGSATGLASSSAWFAESNQMGARFGFSVACAGDVNGDGFADVLLGAPLYDDAQTDEGGAFVYLGNIGRGGWTLAPRQRQADGTAPIAALGRSSDKDEFRLALGFDRRLTPFAWSSGVTPSARLEWEVNRQRVPLDGTRIASGAAQAITGAPLAFDEIAQSPTELALTFGAPLHTPFDRTHTYHWRARVRTTNPLFPVTPWVTLAGSCVTEAKLRFGPMQRKR